jgi:hypothetical protein
MEISLLENQIPHVEKLSKILTSNYVAFDMSMMGSGKTYTSSEIAKRFKFPHVCVICPATVESKWKEMAKYGINFTRIISYQGLRSRKGSTPTHGLLERHDSDDQETSVFFTATDLLKQITQEGCLFIFDESQNVKNKNDQWHACKTLIYNVIKTGGTSRCLLLSGTPIDKEEHAINLMSMIGFIRSGKLYMYNKIEGLLRLYGAQELINFCKSIDRTRTEDFLARNRFTKDTVHHNCYLMFQEIIKDHITSSIPPKKFDLDMDCKNGYYNLVNEDDQTNLIKAINLLNTAVRYNEEANSVDIQGDNMASITKALMKIEDAKVKTFIRLGKLVLENDPTSKVGIFVNYTTSLEKITESFKDYNPIILHGKIPKEKRQRLIDDYQKPDLTHRVIIANLQVCSTGIDLDDKHGGFKRYAFASPNYVILALQQLIYRFRRTNSKSSAKFRFVYGKCGRREVSILNALARKTSILKDTLKDQVEANVKFPGEFEDDVETD